MPFLQFSIKPSSSVHAPILISNESISGWQSFSSIIFFSLSYSKYLILTLVIFTRNSFYILRSLGTGDMACLFLCLHSLLSIEPNQCFKNYHTLGVVVSAKKLFLIQYYPNGNFMLKFNRDNIN